MRSKFNNLKAIFGSTSNASNDDLQYVNVDGEISLVKSTRSDTAYFMPYGTADDFNPIQLDILEHGFHEHLRKKYTTPSIHIDKSDTVIDCGGFIGGFSIAACKAGVRKVVYVEPTPLSSRCAQLNFALYGCYDRVQVVSAGLGETSGSATLNLSRSGADNSLLEPDEGALGDTLEIQVLSLDDLIEQHQLPTDSLYVKVEAEGFEVEIIRGINKHLPPRITVDVTPERDGESPRDEIESLLKDKGYTKFEHTERCIFACL